MSTLTLTIDIPPVAVALLERFVVAAERIAAALEPDLSGAAETLTRVPITDDFIKQFKSNNAFMKRPPEQDPATPDEPAAADGSPAPSKRWTAARKEMLRRDYPAGVAVPALLMALNALPGPTIQRRHVATYAAGLRLKRPAAVMPGAVAETVPPAPVAAASRPIAASPTPQASPPAPKTAAGPVRLMSYASIIAYAKPLGLYSETHGLDLAKINARRATDGLCPVRIAPSRATAS